MLEVKVVTTYFLGTHVFSARRHVASQETIRVDLGR